MFLWLSPILDIEYSDNASMANFQACCVEQSRLKLATQHLDFGFETTMA